MATRTKKPEDGEAAGGAHGATDAGASTDGGIDDDDLDALFGAPIDEFIKMRDAIAKRLKQAGDKGKGARIASLRRPSSAAWALNHLARRYPQRVEALLGAGERLREAQRGALTPGGGAALREAGSEHRALVNELLRAATAILQEGGFSDAGTHLDRVRDSLLATPTARESDLQLLERGRLTKEIDPGDVSDVLGMLGGSPADSMVESEPRPTATRDASPALREAEEAAAKPKAHEEAPAAKAKTAEEARRLADEQAALRARRAEEERGRREAINAAKRERTEALHVASKTAKEATHLTQEAARLSRDAERAEEAARRARDRADKAELEAREAQARAAEAAGAVEAAEEKLDGLGP